MNARRQYLLAALTTLAAALAPTGAGAESVASSASSAGSQSVGSVSDSFRASSNSSSNDNRKTASGDYRVDAVVAVADRPDRVRLELKPVDGAADAGFGLEMPQQVFAQTHLAAGAVVTAQQRPYGVEFALAETRQPFYLVLDDAWYRELPAHRVSL